MAFDLCFQTVADTADVLRLPVISSYTDHCGKEHVLAGYITTGPDDDDELVVVYLRKECEDPHDQCVIPTAPRPLSKAEYASIRQDLEVIAKRLAR